MSKPWDKYKTVRRKSRAAYRRRNLEKCLLAAREKYRRRDKPLKEALRRQALEVLGGKCLVCGVDDPRGLDIDHIHGDGAEERRNKTPYQILKSIVERGSQGRYQVLCAYHNRIKLAEEGNRRGRPRLRPEEFANYVPKVYGGVRIKKSYTKKKT